MSHYDWERRLHNRGKEWQELAAQDEALSAIEALGDRVYDVATNLPAPGMGLPAFAQATTGDTHMLDFGKPLGKFVLSRLASEAQRNTPSSRSEMRELWRSHGVYCDALSSWVLTAGLWPENDSPLAKKLQAWPGSPTILTERELRTENLTFSDGETYCVENPEILSQALLLGDNAPRIVCLSGWPSRAAYILLEKLVNDGGRLRVHADFDWAGVKIVRKLCNTFADQADPWQFGIEDYERAVEALGDSAFVTRFGAKEKPAVLASDQFDPLIECMLERQLGIPEEAVAADLLGDLKDDADRVAQALADYEDHLRREEGEPAPGDDVVAGDTGTEAPF